MTSLDYLKIGIVPYTNTIPLDYYLPQILPKAHIIRAVPSQLGLFLSRGEIDVAILSTIELLRHPEYHFIPSIGICSHGPVGSVCLFSKTEPAQLKHVALDQSSLSSNMLLQVLMADYWQNQPEYTYFTPPVENGLNQAEAALSIGDTTFAYDGDTPAYDLGDIWCQFSQLPFIYAAWVTREGLDVATIQEPFLEAKQRGLADREHLAAVCAERGPKDQAFYYDYLTQKIYYDVSDFEQAGMHRFFELAQSVFMRHSSPYA